MPGWVVLCGAGVSVAPPSAVPSWWGFNQAVLEELRRRFVDAHRPPVKAARALARLSLNNLDVTEFSQIVADSFAGDTCELPQFEWTPEIAGRRVLLEGCRDVSDSSIVYAGVQSGGCSAGD